MENETLKKYLLGFLSSEESGNIDLRIIEEAEFGDRLEDAEAALLEDYLEGNLDGIERKAFLENYLITAERQERLEFIRLLKEYRPGPGPEAPEGSIFFDKIKAFFSAYRFLPALGALGLIFAVGMGFWLLNPGSNPADKELIALNQKDLSNLDEFKNIKNISLSPGNQRSAGGNSNILEAEISENNLIRLVLPPEASGIAEVMLKFSQNSQVLASFEQNTIQGKEVRLLLPKSLLKKGDYSIALENKDFKLNYYLSIQ